MGVAERSGVHSSRSCRPSRTSRRRRRAARSDYNALQLSLRQRTNQSGFEYLASYTLGKVQTNNRGFYGSAGVQAEGAYWMNTYEPEWNYGPAFFDVRHNFVFSANYELPFGRGRKWGGDSSALVDAVLGGWRLSGIFQARTGFPITVIDGSAPSLQGVRGNERPNCVGDPKPADQSITHWLDINAFQRVPRGTWGNCGIGVARAPAYRNIDLVLAKRFSAGGDRAVRVPCRGLQPHQHAELLAAAVRHQRAERVRHHHEHGEHCEDRRAGLQVLLLADRSPATRTRAARFPRPRRSFQHDHIGTHARGSGCCWRCWDGWWEGGGLTTAVVGLSPSVEFVRDELPRLASGASFPQTEYPVRPRPIGPFGLITKLRHLGLTFLDRSVGRGVSSVYTLLLVVVAIATGWRAGRHPAGTPRERLWMAAVWLTILNFASYFSPFVGSLYGAFGTIWLLTLLAALSETPRERALAAVAFLHDCRADVRRAGSAARWGGRDPGVLRLALAGHVAVLATNALRRGGLVARTPCLSSQLRFVERARSVVLNAGIEHEGAERRANGRPDGNRRHEHAQYDEK